MLAAVGGGAVAGRWSAPAAPATTTEVVYRSPAVVTAIERLARLETARFHMERVVDLTSKQQALLGLVEAEDALLLVAAADVTAGIDLGTLDPDEVDIDGAQVSLCLPSPRVFEATLDEANTYVYRRDTDVLADRDQDLEAKARRHAVEALEEAAVAAGLLDVAKEQAATTMVSLVSSLGYDQVDVTFGCTK